MEFLFSLWNHSPIGKRSLEDIIGIIGHQLIALGHKAMWDIDDNKFIPRERGYNLIVEGFTPWTIQHMSEAHQMGARFVIIATEEPTEKGFNHGTQVEMIHRQGTFPEAAKFADGILHLVPGDHVTKWFSQFAPTAYTELGYAPSLFRKTAEQPTYDFGFYGSLSKRRLAILKKLARRMGTEKAVRIVADFTTQAERDAAMRKARVIVQLRKFDQMGLVSSSRCNTALCLGRPVIAEPHELSKPWDEIVRFSSTLEGFFDMAIMLRATWEGAWESQFARFKEKLSPEACLGQAFEKIGIPLRKMAA